LLETRMPSISTEPGYVDALARVSSPLGLSHAPSRILTAHSHAPARDARVTAGLVCIVTCGTGAPAGPRQRHMAVGAEVPQAFPSTVAKCPPATRGGAAARQRGPAFQPRAAEEPRAAAPLRGPAENPCGGGGRRCRSSPLRHRPRSIHRTSIRQNMTSISPNGTSIRRSSRSQRLLAALGDRGWRSLARPGRWSLQLTPACGSGARAPPGCLPVAADFSSLP